MATKRRAGFAAPMLLLRTDHLPDDASRSSYQLKGGRLPRHRVQDGRGGPSARRYTRLSDGFSRKIENHMAAVAINYFAYNFIRIHWTLRVTAAMPAGVTTLLFDVGEAGHAAD